MKHIVLDFDCTVSVIHFFKAVHMSSHPARDMLIASCGTERVDTHTRQFVAVLQAGHTVQGSTRGGHTVWSNSQTTGPLSRCVDLAVHLLGGPERVRRLSRFLERTTSSKAVVHIATHGVAREVRDLLDAAGIWRYFTYLHGRTDTLDVVLRRPDGSSSRRKDYGVDPSTTEYDGKFEFMRALAVDAPVLYADDSTDYLDEVRQHPRIWWLPGLPYEGRGLEASHLDALEAQLHRPDTWPMYPDPIETTSAVVLLPMSRTQCPQALVVLLDVSESMGYYSRMKNARKAITAVAPRYATGGVFILPWNHDEQPLIQIHHPGDEEEVAHQLQDAIVVSGGTSYRAAARSLVMNASTIVDRLAARADVTVLFVTDSTNANDENVNLDHVVDTVRGQLGERVRSLTLSGINVYGQFYGESAYSRVEAVFSSFRPGHAADETWCTIRSTADVDTRIRAILGATTVVVGVEVVGPTAPGVTVRVSGGSGATTAAGLLPLQETMVDRAYLILVVSRPLQSGTPPTELTLRVSLPAPTTYRLKLQSHIRLAHREPYMQRMFQSVRTNVMESVEEDLTREGSGFGVDPRYADRVLAPAFRALEQEHADLMESLHLHATDQRTQYMFRRWSDVLVRTRGQIEVKHDSLRIPVVAAPADSAALRHRIAALRHQRVRLQCRTPEVVAHRVDPVVVASVYIRHRRGDRPAPYPSVQLGTLDRELAQLEQQLARAEEEESALPQLPVHAALPTHRYIARRYLSSAHRRRRVMDFSRYTRVQGECDICYSGPVNLYIYACCSKTICGDCGVNLTDRCPFCRASPATFV